MTDMVERAAGGPQWATSLSGKMHEASWKLMIDAALSRPDPADIP